VEHLDPDVPVAVPQVEDGDLAGAIASAVERRDDRPTVR